MSLPIQKMIAFVGGKTLLEGPNLINAMRHVAVTDKGFGASVFFIDNPCAYIGPLNTDDNMPESNFPDRIAQNSKDIHGLDRKVAQLELKQRQDEIADVKSDYILAEMRGDRQAMDDLKPRLAEFAALEARAHAPDLAKHFTDADADQAADDILREYGLNSSSKNSEDVSMLKPDFGTRYDRSVAVGVGDADGAFQGTQFIQGVDEAKAEAEADEILRSLGLSLPTR